MPILNGLLVTTFLLGSAQASINVTCRHKNCLQSGWTLEDVTQNLFHSIECLQPSCAKGGWVEKDVRGGAVLSLTECIDNDCFENGWVVYDSWNRWVARNECFQEEEESAVSPQKEDEDYTQKSCMTEGWKTITALGYSNTSCVDGDCWNSGWNQELGNGFQQRARCKKGGCFIKGWIFQ